MAGKSVLSALRRLPDRHRGLALPRGPTRLPAMIASAGRQRATSGSYDWHGLQRGRSEFVIFQHTFAGWGRLQFEGQPYQLGPGQTMLVHLPHDHHYWLDEGGTWEFFYLCLHGTEVLRAWRMVVARLGPVVCLPEPIVEAAAACCRAVLANEIQTPGRASALAYDLAMRLLDHSLASHAGAASRDPAIERAVAYCRAHVHEPLQVDNLAKVANYSRWHFTRRFYHHEGMTPGTFIMREKMRRAGQLLAESEASVKAVAEQCGFGDPNYFAKVFHRAFGLSPTQYRLATRRISVVAALP